MAEKVTEMVLKVDLQCSTCFKKVKKVLCKFPQIRDHVYDEKQNTVTITVVCCSPEKIRDKICCKGGKAIRSIEIKEPPKPKAPEKPKDPEKPKPTEKPKEAEKSKEPEKPKADPEKPKSKPPAEKKPPTEAPKADTPKVPVPAPPPKAPAPVPVNICEPVNVYPPMPMYPGGGCCGPCSQGYAGGPCYHGYGRPAPPPPGPCNDGYGYGYSRCCVSGDYFSEENPQGCRIM